MLLAPPVVLLLTLAVIAYLPDRLVVWVVGVAVLGLILSLILRLAILTLAFTLGRELVMLVLLEEVLLWIGVALLVRPLVLLPALAVLVELLVRVSLWVVGVVV